MMVSPAVLEDSELDHLVPAGSSGPLWSQLAHVDLLIIIMMVMIVGHSYMPVRVLRIFTPYNYP